MNIVLPTYNRLDYLKRSVASLLASEMGEDDYIWIYDDASTEQGVKEFLLENESDNFKLSFGEKNLGCDDNVYQSIKKTLEQTDDKFIVATDPDAIYNPEWLSFIKRKLLQLGHPSEKVGLLSVFNTVNHPEKQQDDLTQQSGMHKDPMLCQKKSIGGLALAVNRDVFDKVNPNVVLNHQSSFCWDWQCVTLCKEMGYDILCSKESYVDHIGFIGAHSNSEALADKAQNFLGENKAQGFEDFIL